jgi:hypothetical protein
MKSKADEYRANADQCEWLAEQDNDPVLGKHYLVIAQQWRLMAETADVKKAEKAELPQN